MEDLNVNNIEKLLRSEPSEKILIRALKELKPKRENWKQRLILSLICLFLGIIIGINYNTVELYQDSVGFILDILLAFLVLFLLDIHYYKHL